MIPQLIILTLFGLLLSNAYRHRFDTPQNLDQFRATLIFVILIVVILTWGNFFNPLIERIR